jgi:peptidoglycan hydrolase CwlO-like protein
MTTARPCDDHERFRELSALSNAGALSSSEVAELHAHLQHCRQCREAHDQYRFLAQVGIPELAAIHSSEQEDASWDDAPTRRKLLARIRRNGDNPDENGFSFASLQSPPGFANRYTAFAGAALALCLALIVAGAAYHVGRRNQGTARVAFEDRLQALKAEKQSAQDQLGSQADRILRLQEKDARNAKELADLKLALRAMTDRANEVQSVQNRTEEQMRLVSDQRDTLSVQLREAEQANQNIQAELASLRSERDRTQLRAVSLESKIDELTAATRDQDRRLKDNEQYLASDRDIRELMGARQLYIADVYDVDSRSRTRKSFGRVFYTQGKSLIFYAFDLDPGVKNVNAYQVWGRKETPPGTQARPKSLGILYLDSETNHRWVMRFDDPKQLEELDAVFVTVEPRGGSSKPTTKPFLYALLRQEANHP